MASDWKPLEVEKETANRRQAGIGLGGRGVQHKPLEVTLTGESQSPYCSFLNINILTLFYSYV